MVNFTVFLNFVCLCSLVTGTGANVDMCTSFLGRRGLYRHTTQLINMQMQMHARLASSILFPHVKDK